MKLVMYHANCVDGFGAATIAWNFYNTTGNLKLIESRKEIEVYRTITGEYIAFIPCQYGKSFMEYINTTTLLTKVNDILVDSILIVDFSFKKDEIIEVADGLTTGGLPRIVILDHHKTAEAELKNLIHSAVHINFDMSQCGSLLTYKYFYPNTVIPALIKFINDRDLWLWAMVSSKEVSAWLWLLDRKFEIWSLYLFTSSPAMGKIISEGEIVLKYQATLIAQAVSAARIIAFRDVAISKTFAIVNSPNLQSEICDVLLKDSDMAACYYHDSKTGNFIWSVRSKNQTARAFAERFNGGGHDNAAGFKTQNLHFLELL